MNLVPRLARNTDDRPLQDGRLGEGVSGHQDEHHLESEGEDVLRAPDPAVPRLERAGRRRTPHEQRDEDHDETGEDDGKQVRVRHETFDIPHAQIGQALHQAASFGLRLFGFFALNRWLFVHGLWLFARRH